MSAITEYTRRIPQEVRSILEVLGEPSRMGLLKALAEERELSFRELQGLAKPLNASTLTYHLKALMKAGLVENHYRKVEGKGDYSFYQLTGLAKEFMKRVGIA